MAKPKIPNQKAKYKALNKRLNKYSLLAMAVVASFISEAVNTLYTMDYEDSPALSFDSDPIAKGQLERKRSSLVMQLLSIFLTYTALEWAESNKVQDMVADKVLSAYDALRDERYYQKNEEQLRAFQNRVYSGKTTLDRLNDIALSMQHEIETAISVCIGQPIPIITKRVEQYFGDVKTLRKDFKRKFGYEPQVQDTRSQASSLLRSEINMAYRKAEQERWHQMDFVVGYEIKRSATHATRVPHGDVCDTLAGKYPKDFRWLGWHPRCACYAIPILKTEHEFFNDLPSQNEVTELPEAMTDWMERNKEYVQRAKQHGTLPYWIKDNLTQ